MGADQLPAEADFKTPGPACLVRTHASGIGDAAEWYASHGFPVFPLHSVRSDRKCTCRDVNCSSPGKHPRTAHGLKDATTDRETIERWWTDSPDANIGLVTGQTSGLVVLDIDPRNGGNESFEHLLARYGPLPDTAEQITGGGGRHFFFRFPAAGKVRGKLAPGVDVKGAGGYVVVAPPKHASGRLYEWGGTRGIEALSYVAELPDTIVKLVHCDGPGEQISHENAGKVPEGHRNNYLCSLAGTMQKRGMSAVAIGAALLEENRWRCVPPLPSPEVAAIAESVSQYPSPPLKYGRKGHAPLPDSERRRKPVPLHTAAFHGIAGEFVRVIEPHTEADPAAVLVQFLIAIGVFVGRTGYYLAEGDRHHTNLFAAIVGNTSKGRKGTSWSQIRRLLRLTDEEFANKRITSGISTGEGLIWAVRDEIREQHAVKERGRVTGYEQVIADPGISDKRLLVQESEFARVLSNTQREMSTVSAVIREAWDSGTLNILTKTKTARATNAHIGIIAHITSDELIRLLTSTQVANGFANRFLWVCAARSKELPFGGNLAEQDLLPFAERIGGIRASAESADRVHFGAQAAQAWRTVYGPLSAGKPGLLGAAIGRAEAQVVRLATLYALLDCDNTIRPTHLRVGLAVWDYCEASARYIFGDALGDDTADAILGYLRSVASAGATRTDISNFFNRNKSAQDIGRALAVLSSTELVRMVMESKQSGPPVERWFPEERAFSYEIDEINEISQAEEALTSYNSSNSYSFGWNA